MNQKYFGQLLISDIFKIQGTLDEKILKRLRHRYNAVLQTLKKFRKETESLWRVFTKLFCYLPHLFYSSDNTAQTFRSVVWNFFVKRQRKIPEKKFFWDIFFNNIFFWTPKMNFPEACGKCDAWSLNDFSSKF